MRKVMGHLAFAVVYVYLDDIYIFLNSMPDHVDHLRQVCEILRSNKLYALLDK